MTAIRAALIAALIFGAAACEREARVFRTAPDLAEAPNDVQISDIRAGGGGEKLLVQELQDNRWAVSEGKRLYEWFNCAGCHAPGGGGAMGPPFIDHDWIYGNAPENVFASIVQGRPNGMPSFRDRVDEAEIWKLVAYVRTLGSLTAYDVWPSRGDELAEVQQDGPGSDRDATRVPVEPPPARP